jgi:hypothetical protein
VNGLLTGYQPLPNTLMGTSSPPASGLMGGMSAFNQANPSLAYGMGPLSQAAYQLAWSPHYGPYSSVPTPTASTGGLYPSVAVPASSVGGGTTTTTTAGGGLGSLLLSVAANPALAKNLGSAVSGLFGGSPAIPEAGASDADMLAAYGGPAAGSAPAAAALPEAGASDAAMAGAYGAPAAADALSTVTPSLGLGDEVLTTVDPSLTAADYLGSGASAAASAGGDAASAAGGAADASGGLLGAAAPILAWAGPVAAAIGAGLSFANASSLTSPAAQLNYALSQGPTLGAGQNAPGLLNPFTGQPIANPEYQAAVALQAAGQTGNPSLWRNAYNNLLQSGSGGGDAHPITQMR